MAATICSNCDYATPHPTAKGQLVCHLNPPVAIREKVLPDLTSKHSGGYFNTYGWYQPRVLPDNFCSHHKPIE